MQPALGFLSEFFAYKKNSGQYLDYVAYVLCICNVFQA